MRFGGHETFPVREGWLHKGLKLLVENPALLVDEFAADHLGVGRNMAKSIRHWLMATKLAELEPQKKKDQGTALAVSPFGECVYKKDPYFLEKGTWWALHINLVSNPEFAASWDWFFNHFNLDRFEKSVCIESLRRYLKLTNQRMPAAKTLERDLGCLFATYAKSLPPVHEDPEEAMESPFLELDLMTFHRSSGYYELNKDFKDIPLQILGYSIAASVEAANKGEGFVDIPFLHLNSAPSGPIKSLVLTTENLFELAQRAENHLPDGDIQIKGLASERMLRIQKKSSLDWLDEYYSALHATNY